MVDIMIDLIQPYNEEETAFQNALDQAVLLTPAQQTGLRNDNVISATDLGPLDDATILDCFTNATRLTAPVRGPSYTHFVIGSVNSRSLLDMAMFSLPISMLNNCLILKDAG
jgi:hypothetical protein